MLFSISYWLLYIVYLSLLFVCSDSNLSNLIFNPYIYYLSWTSSFLFYGSILLWQFFKLLLSIIANEFITLLWDLIKYDTYSDCFFDALDLDAFSFLGSLNDDSWNVIGITLVVFYSIFKSHSDEFIDLVFVLCFFYDIFLADLTVIELWSSG